MPIEKATSSIEGRPYIARSQPQSKKNYKIYVDTGMVVYNAITTILAENLLERLIEPMLLRVILDVKRDEVFEFERPIAPDCTQG